MVSFDEPDDKGVNQSDQEDVEPMEKDEDKDVALKEPVDLLAVVLQVALDAAGTLLVLLCALWPVLEHRVVERFPRAPLLCVLGDQRDVLNGVFGLALLLGRARVSFHCVRKR